MVAALEALLKTSRSITARRNAVWALTRIDSQEARATVRIALNDGDASVRQAALHSAGLWRDAAAAPQLVEALRSNQPALQRAAAEALGRVGDARVVRDLISVAALPHDRVLEHSLTYALIEIGAPAPTIAEGLQSTASRAKRASLIALDQMDGGGLQPEGLIPLLDSTDPIVKATAWWIAGRHPEWGGALAGFFKERLASPTVNAADRSDLQQKLVQFGEHAAIQGLLAAAVERTTSRDERLTALSAMALVMKARLKELPPVWVAPLVRALEPGDADVARHGVAVMRAVPAGKTPTGEMRTALLAVARDRGRGLDLRMEALAAIGGGFATMDADIFELLLAGLDPAQPLTVRTASAGVIEKATLDAAQLRRLATSLEAAGPLELPRLLAAFDRGGDEPLGLALIAALEQSKGRSSVRAETLRPRLVKFPETVQQKGDALLASLHVDSAKQSQRLDALLASVETGDVRRGQVIFNSPKTACASCHAIGYLGGRIGPDLTRIGQVRTGRDLLEAIVFPSVSFARGYEPVVVRTTSGETHTGVLRADLPDEVVLATLTREETRIPRREIADLQPATVSLMPPGLDEQLTRQELADLIAFLKAAR
jgi:putative heme-binding domain-containing protein